MWVRVVVGRWMARVQADVCLCLHLQTAKLRVVTCSPRGSYGVSLDVRPCDLPSTKSLADGTALEWQGGCVVLVGEAEGEGEGGRLG